MGASAEALLRLAASHGLATGRSPAPVVASALHVASRGALSLPDAARAARADLGTAAVRTREMCAALAAFGRGVLVAGHGGCGAHACADVADVDTLLRILSCVPPGEAAEGHAARALPPPAFARAAAGRERRARVAHAALAAGAQRVAVTPPLALPPPPPPPPPPPLLPPPQLRPTVPPSLLPGWGAKKLKPMGGTIRKPRCKHAKPASRGKAARAVESTLSAAEGDVEEFANLLSGHVPISLLVDQGLPAGRQWVAERAQLVLGSGGDGGELCDADLPDDQMSLYIRRPAEAELIAQVQL